MTHQAIQVFVVEDDEFFGKLLINKLQKREQYEIHWFRSGQEFNERQLPMAEIICLDYFLPETNGVELLKRIKEESPETSVIVMSAQEELSVVVDAYNNKADYYVIKDENAVVQVDNNVASLAERVELRREIELLRSQVLDRSRYQNIIGESEPVRKVINLIEKVQNSDILTLITGESGTGKEVVANTIHLNSQRKRKPFVAVNVAAIPDDLVESELFGHEKGAFTGANNRRIGKFEEAHGGTIFLDEIGEIDLNLQTKLLRVLQEKKVIRLGSNKEIELDLRVIAATNKRLHEQVKAGKFREDLYYRLQGFLIHLPPLRERGNDVIILARYFLDKVCQQNKLPAMSFTKDALEKLMLHTWPGNVRELQLLVERAALISEADKIRPEDLLFSPSILNAS
ncbi:MAG: sigma-54-dependent Fis family transcriptional regulator [Cytophagales bacterium]|nr:sigma-54-dependent Fis family transcriptional regulator [Cytophagales bacterium]